MSGEFAAAAVAASLAVAVLMSPGNSAPRRRLLRAAARSSAATRSPALAARRGVDAGTGLSDVAMMLELIGAMLDAGAGLGRALELVAARASPELSRQLQPVISALALGASWETAWHSAEAKSPRVTALRDALTFAAFTGAPSAAILFAQAERLRRERFRTAERRAAALGVRLVVPLGLCSLPAFICLGVVPVLLTLLPT